MERPAAHWQSRLPDDLLPHVVPPVRMESHHDDGVPASKWRGYGADGSLCYYRHHFAQWDASLDAEDEPVVHLLREEDFEAWRTPLGAWIRHVLRIEGDGHTDGRVHGGGFELVEPQAIPRL